MKKVLIFGMTPAQGGIETFVLNLCNVIQDTADVFLYNFSNSPLAYTNELKQKYNVEIFDVVAPTNIMGHFVRKFQYNSFFKKHKFDIVHINANSPSNYDFAKSALKSGARVIYHSHNDNSETFSLMKSNGKLLKFVREYQKNKLEKMDIVRAAVSENAAKWMFQNIENVNIIPNGLDFTAIKFSTEKRDAGRKKLEIAEYEKVGLSASRLTKQKNFDKILAIVESAIKNNVIQKMLIVGDGDEYEKIKKNIQSFPVEIRNNIHLLGSKTDMQYWYSVADFLLMPSMYEGLPYTVLEAQANGLNIVASRAIPTRAVINSSLVSILDVNDENEVWVQKISELQKKNSDRKNDFEIANQSIYSLTNFKKVIFDVYNFSASENIH